MSLIHALLDELRDIWVNRVKRTWTIFYSVDGTLLAIGTLGRCQIGETISSKLWLLEQNGKWMGRFRKTVDWAFEKLGEVDHCQQSYKTFLRITGAQRG